MGGGEEGGNNNNNNNNNAQLLQELEALSSSLYQSHTRRTASLALPRAAHDSSSASASASASTRHRRRMSLSPWRSRPPNNNDEREDDNDKNKNKERQRQELRSTTSSEEKRGGGGSWKRWKAIRALSHIGMQKVSCLLSVEVVAVNNLPPSMNGLRLSVCVRKKETRDGAVHTMPSRVSQGAADFEETLFLRCHIYYSPSDPTKFDPRPFWVYAFAVDAPELDFGRSLVDLATLIHDSVQRSQDGDRVRTWDVAFPLSGKAKGADLLLKLSFQIMDKDGGLNIYTNSSSSSTTTLLSPSLARKHSKSSFSVPSPKQSTRHPHSLTPLHTAAEEIDQFNLDEPDNKPQDHPPKPPPHEQDLPDFEVVDKGVEFHDINEKNKQVEEEEEEEEEESVKSAGDKSVVKEIDRVHVARLTELDSIAQQIKALESSMIRNEAEENAKVSQETRYRSQRLDADEETVTREFLQMLEDEDDLISADRVPELSLTGTLIPELNNNNNNNDDDDDHNDSSSSSSSKTYLPDLGKNLGCVVQTRDGGYLASMNPFDAETSRKETPKLAMQVSRPYAVVPGLTGFEVVQAILAEGQMDDLTGKTAEQIAFEGIAAAVIHGRKRCEGASWSAGRAIASAKAAASAMVSGRKERVGTGIWNVSEGGVSAGEVVAFAMPRLEAMAAEALKIQGEVAEEEAPFEVAQKRGQVGRLRVIPLEEWMMTNSGTGRICVGVGIQLRDPMRRFEAVGGPMAAVIIGDEEEGEGEEKRYKVRSVELGGVRESKSSEKHRLTAMQWLVANNKARSIIHKKQSSSSSSSSHHDVLLWSLSSRVMADMWLNSIRNPDVNLTPTAS